MFPIDEAGRPSAPAYDDGTVRCYLGDVRAVLATLPDSTAHCVVTSPPYWGLRAYDTAPQVWGGDPTCRHRWGPDLRTPWANGMPGPNGRAKNPEASRCLPRMTGPFCSGCRAWRGELGLEPTPDLYVEHVVSVFREIRRVLRDDGVVWLNLGDTYAAAASGRTHPNDASRPAHDGAFRVPSMASREARWQPKRYSGRAPVGFKPKDLIGIPWRVAFGLQQDGWWLRSDLIWNKPNPMPESVRDRPTRAHEYVFLLTRSERYFYDADAVREPFAKPAGPGRGRRTARPGVDTKGGGQACGKQFCGYLANRGRNRRSVWTIPTQLRPEAHFATFPEELPRLCVLAGTSATGCCPECGAPWGRVVDGRSSGSTTCRAELGIRAANGQKSMDASHGLDGFTRGSHVVTATGWRPTCSHTADPVPCTVLDPFAGTGTALAAAKALGRRGIGVELNPAYVEMLRRRVSAVGGERRAA